MSIEKMWKELEADDVDLKDVFYNQDFKTTTSLNPIITLKQTIGISIVLAIIVNVLYLIPLFLISLWTFRLALIIIIVANIWITIRSWHLYQSIETRISPSVPLKKQLQMTLDNIKKWWRLQQKISLIVFPIAVVGGYTLGLVIGSGKSLQTFIANPYTWVKLGIAIIVISIFGFWLINKAFKKAYGKHLEALEENLRQLNEQ